MTKAPENAPALLFLGDNEKIGNHPKPTVLYVPQYVANFVYKKSCSI